MEEHVVSIAVSAGIGTTDNEQWQCKIDATLNIQRRINLRLKTNDKNDWNGMSQKYIELFKN